MPLTDEEKKILEALKAKEGDPEEEATKKRAAWIDKQIAKEEKDAKDAADKKAKEEEEKKKKSRRLF